MEADFEFRLLGFGGGGGFFPVIAAFIASSKAPFHCIGITLHITIIMCVCVYIMVLTAIFVDISHKLVVLNVGGIDPLWVLNS